MEKMRVERTSAQSHRTMDCICVMSVFHVDLRQHVRIALHLQLSCVCLLKAC